MAKSPCPEATDLTVHGRGASFVLTAAGELWLKFRGEASVYLIPGSAAALMSPMFTQVAFDLTALGENS